MNVSTSYSILIIEPNEQLLSPYAYISGISSPDTSVRVSSLSEALSYLTKNTPDLVILSTSFKIDDLLTMLEAIKNKSHTALIPLVLSVDLSQPLCQIPGTTWGDTLGIVHSLTSAEEMSATISRVLSCPIVLSN